LALRSTGIRRVLDRFHDDLALRIKAMPEFRAKLTDSQLNLDHPVWVEDKRPAACG
jgi:hypothetical protein